MSQTRMWIGVDIGKQAHHAMVVDGTGRQLLSRRVGNDENDIRCLVAEVLALGTPSCWAIDVTSGIAALLLAVLRQHRFGIRYVSGFVAHQEARLTHVRAGNTPSLSVLRGQPESRR